jgi:hypothetical protein
MYPWLLALHSILRWVVILAGLLAVVRAFRGGTWSAADDRAGKWYGMSLDVQMLAGLLLYGIFSPLTYAAFADMGAAMGNATLRFYAIEHIGLMVVALALAHVGKVRIRRAASDAAKFRTAAIFYASSLVLVLLATPWPFREAGRPLLPSIF